MFIVPFIQSKVEGGPFQSFAFRPDASTVSLHDASHCCQTDPCAFKLALRVKTLENAEQLGRVGHFKARTIVTDKESVLPIFIVSIELNSRILSFARKFPSVRK
jgi:hypothetical protein